MLAGLVDANQGNFRRISILRRLQRQAEEGAAMSSPSKIGFMVLLLLAVATNHGHAQNEACEQSCQRYGGSSTTIKECIKMCQVTGASFRACMKEAGSDPKARELCVETYHFQWGN
jgi:hypothetical protein